MRIEQLMKFFYTRSIVAILLLAGVACADDTATLRVAGDAAFGAADYAKAVEIYEKILPTLTDKDAASAMAERLRFAKRQLELAKLAPRPAATQPVKPTTAPTTAPARTLHAAPQPGETREMTLHELGNFEFSEDDDAKIPEDVEKLTGLKVKIPGQMVPIDQSGKIQNFMLVNDLMSCCYGTTPKLQNIALVHLPAGKWIAPSSERLVIEGTLKVAVKKEDGFVVTLFEIQATSIKFAAQ